MHYQNLFTRMNQGALVADSESRYLISIHPQYVAAILARTKTVECRKSTIGLSAGALLYLYATAPVKAIQGQARIARIYEGSPEEMWDKHQDKAGVKKEDFFAYYRTAKKAVLLGLADVETYSRAVSLDTLREMQPGFSPPQTARRLGPAFACVPSLAVLN
jgi:predicted transcriptional regulator